MCNCNQFLKIVKSSRSYSRATQVPLDKLCNSYLVQNTGNSVVIVDVDTVLQPTQSFGFGGNKGEIFDDRLDIQFQLPNPVPPGYVRNDKCAVVQKIYKL